MRAGSEAVTDSEACIWGLRFGSRLSGFRAGKEAPGFGKLVYEMQSSLGLVCHEKAP